MYLQLNNSKHPSQLSLPPSPSGPSIILPFYSLLQYVVSLWNPALVTLHTCVLLKQAASKSTLLHLASCWSHIRNPLRFMYRRGNKLYCYWTSLRSKTSENVWTRLKKKGPSGPSSSERLRRSQMLKSMLWPTRSSGPATSCQSTRVCFLFIRIL